MTAIPQLQFRRGTSFFSLSLSRSLSLSLSPLPHGIGGVQDPLAFKGPPLFGVSLKGALSLSFTGLRGEPFLSVSAGLRKEAADVLPRPTSKVRILEQDSLNCGKDINPTTLYNAGSLREFLPQTSSRLGHAVLDLPHRRVDTSNLLLHAPQCFWPVSLWYFPAPSAAIRGEKTTFSGGQNGSSSAHPKEKQSSCTHAEFGCWLSRSHVPPLVAQFPSQVVLRVTASHKACGAVSLNAASCMRLRRLVLLLGSVRPQPWSW